MEAQKKAMPLDQVSRELVNFAVDRGDIKALLQAVPEQAGDEAAINKTALEYELPLLKIICTGWAISYYLADHPARTELGQSFWAAIQEFAERISEISKKAAAVDINYFDLVKERADLYIRTMQMNLSEADPAGIIGLTFAEVCGSKDEALVITAGKGIFAASLENVRRYLEAVEPRPEKDDA